MVGRGRNNPSLQQLKMLENQTHKHIVLTWWKLLKLLLIYFIWLYCKDCNTTASTINIIKSLVLADVHRSISANSDLLSSDQRKMYFFSPFSGPFLSSESLFFWRSGFSQLLVLYAHRENKQGEEKRGSGRRGRGRHPLYTFSLQESNFPLAPNSNCRTLGMYLIYLSVAKSMKWLQKCGWNEQWWITILSKRLRIPWSNYFFHKEEGKKRMEIIPSAEVVFFFPLNERPRQTRHILCHGLSLMTSSWSLKKPYGLKPASL